MQLAGVSDHFPEHLLLLWNRWHSPKKPQFNKPYCDWHPRCGDGSFAKKNSPQRCKLFDTRLRKHASSASTFRLVEDYTVPLYIVEYKTFCLFFGIEHNTIKDTNCVGPTNRSSSIEFGDGAIVYSQDFTACKLHSYSPSCKLLS